MKKYICICICIYIYIYIGRTRYTARNSSIEEYVCMYACMYVCMYRCMNKNMRSATYPSSDDPSRIHFPIYDVFPLGIASAVWIYS